MIGLGSDKNERNDGSPCGDHIEFCTAHTTWKSQASRQQSPHHRHSDNALWWHLKDYPFISDRVPHINKLKSHKSKRTFQTFWTGKTANSIFVIDLIFFFQKWVLCSGPLPALHPPPSTAPVSDVLQILFLEDGLRPFYSAKTQVVLLSVRNLIDDLMPFFHSFSSNLE